jgi:hypothetical protein
MKHLALGLTGFVLALAGPTALLARAPVGDEGSGYKFREAPVNSMGVKSMADLRGKPVLIDFWGTH